MYREDEGNGTIVSVYAPTNRASQKEKDEFYADLQIVIDGVAEEDVLMIMRDFNARVGSSERQEEDMMFEAVLGLVR